MAILTRAEAIERTRAFIDENHPEWKPKKRETFEKFIIGSRMRGFLIRLNSTAKNCGISGGISSLKNIFGSMDELMVAGRDILGDMSEEETPHNRRVWIASEVEQAIIDWVRRRSERGEKFPFPTFSDYRTSHLLPSYGSVKKTTGLSCTELYEKLFEEGKINVKYSADAPETVFHRSEDSFNISEYAYSSEKRKRIREITYGRGY